MKVCTPFAICAPFLLLFACSSAPALRQTPGAEGFDAALPGWRTDSTGGSGPSATWGTHPDAGAVSAPNVVSLQAQNHASEDRFNLFWSDRVRFQDGRIGVAVRADGGTVDQGGGPMWRVQNANNYYICRFNPLESNYRVYVVKDGVRRQLATALVAGAAGAWHQLEVQHLGNRIICWMNGVELLSARDATIAGEGGVGLWTKADARTSFDDLFVSGAGDRR